MPTGFPKVINILKIEYFTTVDDAKNCQWVERSSCAFNGTCKIETQRRPYREYQCGTSQILSEG